MIEFSAVIAKAESIKDAAAVQESSKEALQTSEQKLAEIQSTVSAIIRQLASKGVDAAETKIGGEVGAGA